MARKTETKLYGGDVAITFYPDSHGYRLGDGTRLVSATGATGVVDKSRSLVAWAVGLAVEHLESWIEANVGKRDGLLEAIGEAAKRHEYEKERAAEIGKLVHAYAESAARAQMDGGEMPPIPEDAEPQLAAGIIAFLSWLERNDVRFLHSEQVVYSRAHGYVGTVDAVAEVNGKKVLIDYKTSKDVYPEHRYQVAGYRAAWEEEHGKLDGSLILHLDKETGKCAEHLIPDSEHPKDFAAFLACLAIKRRQDELARKREAQPS